MKIFGINSFNIDNVKQNYYHKNCFNIQQKYIQSPIEQDIFIKSNTINPLQNTNITFGARIIKSQSGFKALVRKRTMHCIYCNKVLVDEDRLNKLQKSGIFSGSIKTFINKTKEFYPSMHRTHKTVFRIISAYAKKSPQTTLEQVIQDLYPKALKKLRKSQTPLFEKLHKKAKALPPEYQVKFTKFMQIQNYRLSDKAYINEFSGKEFNYMLKNMSKTIDNDRLVSTMLGYANHLNHPVFKDKEAQIPENLLNKIFNRNKIYNKNTNIIPIQETKTEVMLHIINEIKRIGQKLNRNDIIKLCNKAENEVVGLPVKVPFSNKTFRYDLNEALENLPDETLKKEMMQLTYLLPTSMNNPYSFIAKHESASSEKIGHNLLFPSIVTIEHMKTKFDSGKNIMGNYALSCAFDNNYVRSNRNMSVVLNRYNKENPQKYFNEIFEVVRNGEITIEDVVAQVKTFEEQSGKKIDITPIKNLIEAMKKHSPKTKPKYKRNRKNNRI